MYEALRMLETEDYKKADVIIASDMIMADFDAETHAKIAAAKENKTKFHSLVIGESGNKNLLADFDSNWLYDTRKPDAVLRLVKDLHGL
jgi:uncharacterized protein with von Willebrand factor type A (vWA) domain